MQVLNLIKMGGDFSLHSNGKFKDSCGYVSNLENYRLRAKFKSSNGLDVTIDFETREARDLKSRETKVVTFPVGWLHGRFPTGRIWKGIMQYTDCVSTPENTHYCIEPNKLAIMKYCNKEFGTNFDSVEIVSRNSVDW